MNDDELRDQIIKDMILWGESIRWTECRVLGANPGYARLLRGALGGYVIGLTKRGDIITATIRCDITQSVIFCTEHLSKNLYNLALEALDLKKETTS